MGATDPKKAAPGHDPRRPRRRASKQNVVHGSDAAETAAQRDRLLLQRRPRSARAADALMHAPTPPAHAPTCWACRGRSSRRSSRSSASKPFRARQLMNWMYKRGVARLRGDDRPGARTSARSWPTRAEIRTAGDRHARRSPPTARASGCCGPTPRQAFEMVYIPEADRGTLCISSQVGCALDCSFCSTAQQGFNRNLSAAEIVGQVWLAQPRAGLRSRAAIASSPTSCSWAWASRWRTSATCVPALRILLDDLGFDLSRRRVTLSHLGPGAADLQAGRGEQRARWRCRCTRRTTSCATSWCRSTASTRSPSCWRPAGTTSTSRTAAASPSST